MRRRLTLGVGLLMLGVSAGIGIAWWQRTPEPAEPPPPAPTASGSQPPAVAAAAPPRASAVPAGESRRASVDQMDVAELLRAQPPLSDWRLARLRGNPQVLVLEFPDLAAQGAAMNRVAAFVEKAGAPRDRVLSDGELRALIARQGDNAQTFYQGHDYVADQLARFFGVARAQRQALNAQETRLLQLLLDKQVLAQQGEGYVAQGLQAIVTFTATQTDDPQTPQDEAVDAHRRESVLLHELSHGLFLTSAAYRQHCLRYWRERLSSEERERFRRLLNRMNYDTTNEELVVNEMQALLMHTPDTRAFSASSLGITEVQLEDLRARFRRGMPQR